MVRAPGPPTGSSALPAGSDRWIRLHTRTLDVKHDVLGFEVPVDDALGVEVAQGQCDLCQVETADTGQGGGKSDVGKAGPRAPWSPRRGRKEHPPGRVFQEDALSLQVCEELAACDTNTSAAVCWGPAPLLSESWFLLGGVGLTIPALPASQSCRGVQFNSANIYRRLLGAWPCAG